MRTLNVVTIVAAAAALSVTAGCSPKESRQAAAPGEPVASSAEAVPEEATEPASAPAETPAPAAEKKGEH
ncbi:hypothetical protein [Caulobacter sp. 17J65-9]|uniref:hypothetical protein n=1 Tax=Caulobacter sp. 17J65-9 TaxID=2709382 RepID=UPI0013CA0351|nr:hypothetical protein [Caulobacter sp. 17J65-9]NEX95245.1 hypothetical protein [Caulobacter sp. 17J65-9]